MKVTPAVRTKIINALSEKGLKASHLAEKVGRDRSWASKLLRVNGSIKELTDDMVNAINDVLGISLRPIPTEAGAVSSTAAALSKLSETDPAIADLLERLLSLFETDDAHIPVVHQKELIKIGAAVTRIVAEWDEEKDPHYAKIGAETLDYLRRYFAKRRR